MAEEPTRERVSPEIALPPVNTLLRMSIGTRVAADDEDRMPEVSTRVENVVPGPDGNPVGAELLVAAPRFAGDLDVPLPTTPCEVTWLTARGIHELPTGFVRVEAEDGLRMWRLRVTGPAYRVQRRRYFRVTCAFPVTLRVTERPGDTDTPADDETRPGDRPLSPSRPNRAGAQNLSAWQRAGGIVARQDQEKEAEPEEVPLIGHTVDLSEGGARCAIKGPLLEAGTKVALSLMLGEERVEATAVVLRAIENASGTASAPDLYELAVSFENPDEYGDKLRRIVFAEQIRARRMSQEG
ncbi:MAG: PilZ domain-containing protein [Actinomycetales bacterium]|nr:PilZ domain-containing protein [Actinomycetales bacterium]